MLITKYPFESHVKRIKLIHFSDSPEGFGSMPPHSSLMTIIAQGYRGVLLALVDVVG
jgi:hypothetical protein